MATIRLLIRPTLFTVGICGTCFSGAAILHYENMRVAWKRRHPFEKDWWDAVEWQRTGQHEKISGKYLAFRQKVNEWSNQLKTGEKIAAGTIFINLLVFGAWRVKRLAPVMARYFQSTVSPATKTFSPLSSMILSCFSHTMPLHFALNMYALYSFSNFATALLGPEQLIGLFISAGAVSSLASIAHRLITKSPSASLGASGALFGVIAYICVARPQSELLLLFIPVAAGTAIKGCMMLDFVGIIARWRVFDHAAHLGGSLFGVWYATYGEKLYYQHKKHVVDAWVKLKQL